jgi:hypothetical protein
MVVSLFPYFKIERYTRYENKNQISNNIENVPEFLMLEHEYSREKIPVKVKFLEYISLKTTLLVSDPPITIIISLCLFVAYTVFYMFAVVEGFGYTWWNMISGVYICVYMISLSLIWSINSY